MDMRTQPVSVKRSMKVVLATSHLIPRGASAPPEVLGSWAVLYAFAKWDSPDGDTLLNARDVYRLALAIKNATGIGAMTSPWSQMEGLVYCIRFNLHGREAWERAISALRSWYKEDRDMIDAALLKVSQDHPGLFVE